MPETFGAVRGAFERGMGTKELASVIAERELVLDGWVVGSPKAMRIGNDLLCRRTNKVESAS